MSDSTQKTAQMPEPIVVAIGEVDQEALQAEWLMTNSIGAYSSSTVVGCNTRRYHGLLVAPAWPPVGRFCALATIMEELTVDGQCCQLATNEFPDAFSPGRADWLVEFRNDVTPTFVYRIGQVELTKEIVLAEGAGAVAVKYTIRGGGGSLRLRPFVALRDFHSVRHKTAEAELTFVQGADSVAVRDQMCGDYAVHLSSTGTFQPQSEWWYDFLYRTDIARGHESREDLYAPGSFVCELQDGQSCQLAASIDGPPCVDFASEVSRRRRRMEELSSSVGIEADDMTRRLAMATDAFIVRRHFGRGKGSSATILAGYHWFADWGRDAFIALPGLLLSTGRFDLARQVFRTFGDHMADGMIPNRFDDYAASAHYNSIDASLWFIVAAERYIRATGDMDFWAETLMPACEAILDNYQSGAQFDIRADADGLLMGGSPETQLTWMDVKFAGESVTPRHGKAVEINALWHSGHRIMASLCRANDPAKADHFAGAAELIAAAFAKTFWNEEAQCLYDCISHGHVDASIRPNQIFAVSLPHSPLDAPAQSAVLRAVTEHLLTPLGLRTLACEDRSYRRQYAGSLETRDRAYHQGTVWAWLIGPFIEAYLKVEGDKPFAVDCARQRLEPFAAHLHRGGLGFVSEVFDGDAPHAQRGCIAQAWSVAEVLRAKQLVETYARKLH